MFRTFVCFQFALIDLFIIFILALPKNETVETVQTVEYDSISKSVEFWNCKEKMLNSLWTANEKANLTLDAASGLSEIYDQIYKSTDTTAIITACQKLGFALNK
jgi:hypothetical protein